MLNTLIKVFGFLVVVGFLAIYLISNSDVTKTKKQSRGQVNSHVLASSSHTASADSLDVEERFAARNHLLKKMCKDKQIANFSWYQRNPENSNATEKATLDCSLRICRVQKVASTYFMSLKWHLAKQEQTRQTLDVCAGGKQTDFLFARDPYTRLLSAYLDKVVTLPLWWRTYGFFITNKFRDSSKKPHAYGCGHDVTFSEFVQFIIFMETTETLQDPHFVPIHKICDVCHREYEYIGKLETFTEDVRFIYKLNNKTVPMDIDSGLNKITSKTKNFANLFNKENYSNCISLCGGMKKVWWGLKAMGLIPTGQPFPFHQEGCSNVTGNEFFDIAKNIYEKNKGAFNKEKQKETFLIKMYQQVPLKDRLRLTNVLKRDLLIFGYPFYPENVFPEYKDG